MASKESSFDIVSEFDFQELRNAVDQVKKEIQTRYDFKNSVAEIELNEDNIIIKSEDDFKVETIRQMLVSKVVNRKLNPKILKFGKTETALGKSCRQEITLIKALDSDNTKKIAKEIRDNFKTVKPTIQGEAVRVFSKSKDDLQTVMQFLREKEDLDIPLVFNNYR